MKTRKPITTRELQNIRDMQRQLDFMDNHPNGRFILEVIRPFNRDANTTPTGYTMYVAYGLYRIGFGFSQSSDLRPINTCRYRPAGSRWRGGVYHYESIDALIRSARRHGAPDQLIERFTSEHFMKDSEMKTAIKDNAKDLTQRLTEEINKFII